MLVTMTEAFEFDVVLLMPLLKEYRRFQKNGQCTGASKHMALRSDQSEATKTVQGGSHLSGGEARFQGKLRVGLCEAPLVVSRCSQPRRTVTAVIEPIENAGQDHGRVGITDHTDKPAVD